MALMVVGEVSFLMGEFIVSFEFFAARAGAQSGANRARSQCYTTGQLAQAHQSTTEHNTTPTAACWHRYAKVLNRSSV